MRFRVWILLMVIAPIVLTATLLTAFFVNDRLVSLENELQGRAAAVARQVAAGSELGLFSANRQMIETVAAAALRDPDVDAVVVRDDGGIVMARLGKDSAAVSAFTGAAVPNHVVVSERVSRPVTPLEDLYASGVSAAKPVGDLGNVVVVMATDSLNKSRSRIIMTALMATSGLCLVAIGFVLVYVRRFARHLALLSDTVNRIGEGDLSVQLPEQELSAWGTVIEFDQLSHGIDAMAQQIGASHRDLAQRVAEVTAELERRRADAERASTAKSRFLAAASHDLRQPLHALGLFADQLSRRSLTGDEGRLVARIVESSGALSELLDALLDISRLDAGAMAPKLVPVDLVPLLRRLEADFETQAEQRDLRLIIRTRVAWVNADAMMLERILINLLSNAIRYTTSGTVMLVVRRSKPGRLKIEVRDSGIGVHHDVQSSIFDEFVQLNNPERDRSKGLGLGLSIVQRMCQLMNCRYGLRSQIGRGSVFWIELPSASAIVALRAGNPAGAHYKTGYIIAVLDDDPLSMEGLSDQLRSWGHQVCAAASSAELIAALSERKAVPDLIFCDHQLKNGEQGTVVLKELRAHFDSTIPAVLVTGDASFGNQSDLADLGVPVLAKPVRPARLRAVMQGLLSGSPASE